LPQIWGRGSPSLGYGTWLYGPLETRHAAGIIVPIWSFDTLRACVRRFAGKVRLFEGHRTRSSACSVGSWNN